MRRTAIIITLLCCGTLLIAMPQIHMSVVAANAAHVASQRQDLAPEAVELPTLARAMAWTSMGMGSAMILAPIVLGLRRTGSDAEEMRSE